MSGTAMPHAALPSANHARLIGLVESYFRAVDRMDLDATLAHFVPKARFTIVSFDNVYEGRDEGIKAMFERLFHRYAKIWHGNFEHVAQPMDRIASRFRVENTSFEGALLVKNNCNFFRLRGDQFEEVQVYMSGDNSLH